MANLLLFGKDLVLPAADDSGSKVGDRARGGFMAVDGGGGAPAYDKVVVVLRIQIDNEKKKQKVMKVAERFSGVEYIELNMKEKKLTVIGVFDPDQIAKKLRKTCATEIISVGPKTVIVAKKKELTKKMEEKKEDTQFYNYMVTLPNKSSRMETPRENNVVGLEEQADTLIKYIIDHNKGCNVFSIVGMPGLGKTTLAWKIYRDPRIQFEFPTLIWIYFSQDLKMRNVLLTILTSFTQNDMSKKHDHELTEMVRDHLKRGKFMIVIDDVWTIEAWKRIEMLLPRSNEKGRVLMTTRQIDVGIFASRPREPHMLEFLSTDKSLELLRMEIYNTPNIEFPPDLDTLAVTIAKKCGGLPLAIRVIGGMLAVKSSTNEWRRVSENVGGYLIEKDREKELETTILVSFLNLPDNLRDCFLYLGMFPGDMEISALKLTQLWIAEGFINKIPGESLEQTSEDNLKELINRNLVMVEKTKITGEVKTCVVHNLIREFCLKIAGVVYLFQEISKSESTGSFEPSKDVIEQCRRLSIHTHVKEFFMKKYKLPKLRSFLCSFKEVINLEQKEIPCITVGFDLIRVLDASPIKFPSLPPKIIKLTYLRYLTLSCTESVKILPEAMAKLCNLQTLTVNTMHRTLEVKTNIWDMLDLRHFKTNASAILTFDGKGEGGENLQTLSNLSTVSCTTTVFNKATNLRTLGICGDLTTILDSNCLEKLERLEKLKLVNEVYWKEASEISLKRFPCRLPMHLKCLTLSDTNLDWSQMSEVGKFSYKLEVLKLKTNAFVGDVWDVASGDFQQLECLYISQAQLQVWTASDGSFPKLRNLVLKNCGRLKGVPNNLLENLTMLSMECVASHAVRSAETFKKKQKEKEGHQMDKRGKLKIILSPENVLDSNRELGHEDTACKIEEEKLELVPEQKQSKDHIGDGGLKMNIKRYRLKKRSEFV